MLPKELVADPSVLAEVCPALSAPQIACALDRYQPDAFCRDPIGEDE